ncbi:MAG: hypothetical protein CMK59_06780 [Proteobacteria bacterium]|nr:hypothetical protein [Pseudomonadota bacterium]
MYRSFLFVGAAVICMSCGNKKAKIQTVDTEKLGQKERQGYPDWITDPYTEGFEPAEAICASSQSNMGLQIGNIDAARSDAEIQVKNRIAEQLKTEVGLLQEKSNEVFRDMSGKQVGSETLKVINQNFQQTSLVGLRYLSTYFHPDPVSPEKIFVLGCVRVDFADMAKTILEEMDGAAQLNEEMEYNHQEAMLRFDEVRKQYLGDKGVEDRFGE